MSAAGSFGAKATRRSVSDAEAVDSENGIELGDVVQRLSLARSLSEIQEIVRTAARRLTGADGASFVLRDGEFCFYADEDAVSPLWRGQRFPMTSCVSGWAMLNRCSAAIPDIYADERVPHDAYRPTFVKSLAIVPIRQIDPIGAIGNYWAELHQPTPAEIAVLQALADCTAVAIENVKVRQQLEHAHQETLRRVNHAAEEERSRWARELHDETLQALGGMRIMLARAQRCDDLDAWSRAGSELIERVEHEIANLRAIVTDLRPPALDQLGLEAALHALGEYHRNTTGLAVSCRCQPPPGLVSTEIETVIYRLVQEALSNVVKHAHADSAEVRIDSQDSVLHIQVRDDGVGFDPGAQSGGFGMLGTRERLSLVGGSLAVESGADGTTIGARIPLAGTPTQSAP